MVMLKEHEKNVSTLRHMLAILMVRQSAWQLSDDERKLTQEGIKALQAAIETMAIQVFA